MKAFLFPGQGSQEVGMAADLFRSDPAFRALVDLAARCVGEDLPRLCRRGPERELQRSRIVQPLIVCVSLGYLRLLAARGVRPDVVLGHSLGEISALAAASVLSAEQAVTLAARRGELMESAASQTKGGMLAVLAPEAERLQQWLATIEPAGQVVLANDNAPNQVVLSGPTDALESCADAIARAKLGTCRKLAVAGPWHGPWLETARREFAACLEATPLRVPAVPLVFNLTGDTETDPERIRTLISDILIRPVRWRESMARLKQLGARELFEVGPGRVLAGLARANAFGDETRVWSVNNLRGLEQAACGISPKAPLSRPNPGRHQVIRPATDAERAIIYQLRHEVYSRELGQHPANAEGRLTDALDAFNTYLVATTDEAMIGFVSVTPPNRPGYSVDKYFRRDQLPFLVDDRLYEIRLLTVLPRARGWFWALALMYAAFRWAEARGGRHIVAIGREEVLSIYRRVGLRPAGLQTRSGAVSYHLLHGTMQDVHEALIPIDAMLRRIEGDVSWDIGVPFRTPAPCYHGGGFFSAVGDEFDHLERLETVINADVLDAWFPPAPGVLSAPERHLARLIRTSPPTGCEGLLRAIGRARGVPVDCLLPGAGSSDLIFRALRNWLTPGSRVLLLDPTYGEYSHVLERVIGCRVDRLTATRAEGYRLDLQRLESRLAEPFDLVVLVNPNSPTGLHVPRRDLEPVLLRTAPATRIWVDETYVEYAGPDQSLEPAAARSENVLVCKSMSKVYALSGARVAYLCAGPHQLEPLRAVTPPWVVSLPAQVAAVKALADPGYYARRYEETHQLRAELATALRLLRWEVTPGVANFLLCHLPDDGPDAATVIARCRAHGLFLRDTAAMGGQLGPRAIRLAVKDSATNARMVALLREVCRG